MHVVGRNRFVQGFQVETVLIELPYEGCLQVLYKHLIVVLPQLQYHQLLTIRAYQPVQLL